MYCCPMLKVLAHQPVCRQWAVWYCRRSAVRAGAAGGVRWEALPAELGHSVQAVHAVCDLRCSEPPARVAYWQPRALLLLLLFAPLAPGHRCPRLPCLSSLPCIHVLLLVLQGCTTFWTLLQTTWDMAPMSTFPHSTPFMIPPTSMTAPVRVRVRVRVRVCVCPKP